MPNYVSMPSCDNKRYKEDLITGMSGEINSQPILEAEFGLLNKSTYKWEYIDYDNENYIIELKTRPNDNHNAYDKYGGLMFNYSKIKKYKKKGEVRKLIVSFNCKDGLYYWEYKEGEYTTGIGGRNDRGCDEYREMAYVPSKYMKTLYEKPNPFKSYLLDSDED